ncbi:MAG: hypothetical protein ACPGXI_17510 [Mycobacterium sp.]
MPPMPPGPNAEEILQGLWEETLEPAELTRRSVELGKLSSELLAVSEDGQVGAMQLLNHGQGVLAETISTSWGMYFTRMGMVAAQIAEASAYLSAWATTLGAMLAQMDAVVGWAEAAIEALEAARVALEATGENVDALIEQIKAEAKSQVAAISAAASAAIGSTLDELLHLLIEELMPRHPSLLINDEIPRRHIAGPLLDHRKLRPTDRISKPDTHPTQRIDATPLHGTLKNSHIGHRRRIARPRMRRTTPPARPAPAKSYTYQPSTAARHDFRHLSKPGHAPPPRRAVVRCHLIWGNG